MRSGEHDLFDAYQHTGRARADINTFTGTRS